MKRNNSFIHWYPGHIAKAERQLGEKLNLVDVVAEVRDARLPISSGYENIEKLLGNKPRLLLLNKSDLVDKDELKKWVEYLKSDTQIQIICITAKGNSSLNEVIKYATELAEPVIQKIMAKGLLRRPARMMVVGMPNVGKSSIINKLTHSTKAKTGAKAGVTRQQQWIRINPKLDLLDTAGIISTKQDDQLKATKLAMVNSVSENAYDVEPVARMFLDLIKNNESYLALVKQNYNLPEDVDLTLESIATARNWIKKGNVADIERTASNILKDFRDGRLGKFVLDSFV